MIIKQQQFAAKRNQVSGGIQIEGCQFQPYRVSAHAWASRSAVLCVHSEERIENGYQVALMQLKILQT